jgi:hypothetical protein
MEELVSMIVSKMRRLGYNVKPEKRHGKVIGIHLGSKRDIARLLRVLPIRHLEKIERRKLFFQTVNVRDWDEVNDKVIALRRKIKEEVRQCIEEARKVYMRAHSAPAYPMFKC